MHLKIFLITGFIFCTTIVSFSSEGQYPYITQSWKTGKYYFKMLPGITKKCNDGSGAVYEVKLKGNDLLSYDVRGWYAFNTYLSSDGNYIVALYTNEKPDCSNIRSIVKIYYKGSLAKEYYPEDCIMNMTKTHYTEKGVHLRTFIIRILGFDEKKFNVFSFISADSQKVTIDLGANSMSKVKYKKCRDEF
jgi:hypothetical protein